MNPVVDWDVTRVLGPDEAARRGPSLAYAETPTSQYCLLTLTLVSAWQVTLVLGWIHDCRYDYGGLAIHDQ